MSGASIHESRGVSQQLVEVRLLTEAHALLAHLDDEANVLASVEAEIKQNLQTAMAEISMPYAVTTTEHAVEYIDEPTGPPRRIITWLGKNAVTLAAQGTEFHFSAPAHQRVAVEVEEAKHTQETLRAGVAQVFISPKMSRADASLELARAEHLADDDSVRVSTAIVDAAGTVVARKMQSLLVRDIPLEAWIEMLQDPKNIFGRAFDLRDTTSAVSVMELFSQLDMPVAALPHGPVSIVEAVLPYVRDELAKQKVALQVHRFKSDQELYRSEAERAASEWYEFELELARSLKSGEATYAVQQLIASQQHEWDAQDLTIIQSRSCGDMRYVVDDTLAAVLEKRKRLLLGRIAAVITHNDTATVKITTSEKAHILQRHAQIMQAETTGVHIAHLNHMRANLARQLARTNITVGGGCAGNISGANGDNDLFERTDATGESLGTVSSGESKEEWTWKSGTCQVKTCPSPKPTEVGPCSVCRRCQDVFDRGGDPTLAISSQRGAVTKKAARLTLAEVFGLQPKILKTELALVA